MGDKPIVVKKELRTIPHLCHRLPNIAGFVKPCFICDNLYWSRVKRRFLCKNSMCPFDDREFPTELLELEYGQ